MAKGYWVVHVTVTDPVAYERYRAANAAPLAEYGARFVVRGGPQEVTEGGLRPRTVVIEFPSLQAARDCYFSPGYQAAIALRMGASEGDFSIVEGWEG